MLADHIMRLDWTLRKANIPIHGVAYADGVGRIDYKDEATAEQTAAGQAILESFEWTDEAHALWLVERNKEKVTEIVTSSKDPVIAIIWAAMTEIHNSIVSTRAKVNELVAHANASDAGIEGLTNRTMQQVIYTVLQDAQTRV